MSPIFLLIPILFPILFGALTPLFHFQNHVKRECYVLTVVVINTLLTWFLIVRMSVDTTLTVLPLAQTLTVRLRMDGMAKVFAGLVASLWPFATLYAFEYMRHEGRENSFFAFYTITFGITMGIACSANVMTMYLFYELLTLVTLPLVMHSMDHKSIRAGIRYMKYSIGGAAVAFLGFMLLHYYGHGNEFVFGGILTNQGILAKNTPILVAAYMMMFFGFGVKAAIFPLHGWLPSASVAPTPVTALLHAVAVVKSGVFAILRVTYFSFGTDFLQYTWGQYIPLIFAIITIVFGSAMAVKEQHIKRRLAYSTVSNLSYILFGGLLMTKIGLVAALSHMVFHGVMKISLFFCAGAIMHQTGSEYIYEINGYGKKMKKVFAVFLIGSMALVGVPPFAGFTSKWLLLQAGMDVAQGPYVSHHLALLGIAALLLSAMLTAIYLFVIVVRAYFPDAVPDMATITIKAQAKEPAKKEKEPDLGEHPNEVKDPNWYMIVPLVVFSTAMLVLGIYSGPLLDFFSQIIPNVR